ncbi:MAG: universal stress protein [Anaerolineales bacterium]|nr:universal stress protein [Anaerolineales bacterium]
MAHVSRKLSNSFEGALAGGGDPATSPLYVFGPFLRLIVVAGVASVTFGSSVWMVVITIALVSAMYRLVMGWITDGSGGSGLSEEEFGPWAVKINAGITFIEYTLTFLVSMAAMVTFIADRAPVLNESILGIQYRTFIAIVLSVVIGWLVNRGPKVAARAFGPATLGVLILLWAMVIATLVQYGLQLPDFNLQAFSPEYIWITFGGYARILAVMTGIEVFANLVAAYEGDAAQKSRKAFGSLLIIMGTASVTMLIVGPAIFNLSDPLNPEVSVFTQTMDALLPAPLAYAGTIVGILVLMSASAASAQGLQNLALGLADRKYIPAFMGQRNRFGVADKPVWLEVGLVVVAFLLLGTHEETYLAIYAAGVFILLSMTGWAATKRLVRQVREKFSPQTIALIAGTIIAAALTTGATLLIFAERFLEGAWTYLVFIPILYVLFTYFRNQLGEPTPAREQLGELEAAMLGGFGYGQQALRGRETIGAVPVPAGTDQVPQVPAHILAWSQQEIVLKDVLVPLDGSSFAEMALPLAENMSKTFDGRLFLVTAVSERQPYLQEQVKLEKDKGLAADFAVGQGSVVEVTCKMVESHGVDLVVTSSRGGSGARHWMTGGVASRLVQEISKPVIVVQTDARDNGHKPGFNRVLVPLDGSRTSELIMPYALAIRKTFKSELILLMVPEIPDPSSFGASVDWVERKREEAVANAWSYLESLKAAVNDDLPPMRAIVSGSRPAYEIVEVAEKEKADLIMMATHGRGGLDRLWVGSVMERVVATTNLPVFLLPVRNGSSSKAEAARERAALEQP